LRYRFGNVEYWQILEVLRKAGFFCMEIRETN